MNIFEINNDYLELQSILEMEELTPELEQALEINEENFKSKIEAMMYVYRTKSAKAGALKAEMDRLKAIKDSNDKVVERIETMVKNALILRGLSNYETEFHKLGFRRSERVVIDDLTKVPKEYVEKKVELVADKNRIKAFLKTKLNKVFAWAHIEENQNLQIK